MKWNKILNESVFHCSGVVLYTDTCTDTDTPELTIHSSVYQNRKKEWKERKMFFLFFFSFIYWNWDINKMIDEFSYGGSSRHQCYFLFCERIYEYAFLLSNLSLKAKYIYFRMKSAWAGFEVIIHLNNLEDVAFN